MITKIRSIEDVELFAYQLTKEGVSFHPDDDFIDYINFGTSETYYSKEEAEIRNRLMDQCFQVCERLHTDIYDVMLNIVLSCTEN
ncbi:MAG: hypothetical protein K8R68_02770 [Bacteroidales bacterium]|nr:hypothetical protein [Bacteroidales bacterium]